MAIFIAKGNDRYILNLGNWAVTVTVLFYCAKHTGKNKQQGELLMKKINKKLAAACILSVLCAGYSTIGFAAEEKEEKAEIQSFALDEYVVTANRTEQTIFNANANISVITKADIERMHYDTLDKALTAVPGVQFKNYSGSQGLNLVSSAPVMINGSKNVLILVDGVRMTPVGGGANAIKMELIGNMNNVERIEVLKGAAGVLYGSDAAGGVINIITKKGNENKTTLKASKGNFGKKNYHFSNSGTEGVVSWNVYYDEDKKGDYKDGSGKEWENKWDSHAGGIDLTTKVSDKHEFGVSYNESKADFSGVDPSPYDYDASRGYQKFKGANYTQDTTLSHTWNFDDNTSNKLIYKTERYNWDYFENSEYGFGNNQGASYKTSVISNQFTKRFDDNHTLVTGFEFTKSENLPEGFYKKDGWRYIKNKSYFIQDTWTFDEKWNATAGIRYDSAEAFKKGEIRDMDSNISKSMNIAYNFDNRNNMYVSYDDYFIVPSVTELFHHSAGNSNLEPATGKNYSIGYNHIIDDNSNISVHAFQRKADVSITLANAGGQGQYANFKNEKNTGFDIQYNKRFDEKWNAFIGYTFLKHESDANYGLDTIKLGYLPRHAVNLGVNYTYDKWDIGLTGRGFLSRDDAEAGAANNDSFYKPNWLDNHYWLFDIGANYQATDNIKVFAAVNNIFDVMYAENMVQGTSAKPGTWYGMPGRSFVAGVEVSF